MGGKQLVRLQHPHADVDDLIIHVMESNQAEPVLRGYRVQRVVQLLAVIGAAVIFEQECPNLSDVQTTSGYCRIGSVTG
ncbi:hypothetical protein CM49_04390 [Paenibacillus sp. P1XP2]|nr:hypothetical protein CM49_04390 [Paenibacillus sp. P1XP2]